MGFTFNRFHNLMLDALDWKSEGKDLNSNQIIAVEFGAGPLWIIAGPGSGKSEVLIWRALKLILVDEIDPRSILITTFTEKAGQNLQDRISQYVDSLISQEIISYNEINVADMRIGTLHSICNEILQEYRYEAYQNKKLMDDIEQSYFAYRYVQMTRYNDLNFWREFTDRRYLNRWDKTKLSIAILDRITEDLVDKDELRNSGNSILIQCAQFHDQYLESLNNQARCDYATLQSIFLEFLGSPQGKLFLKGDETRNKLPLKYILVDEYQDTNPIQELIYFRLAGGTENIDLRNEELGNITVVGDDDQALYRFRGGTVDLLVNFDNACQRFLGKNPHRIQLIENFRSHPDIVNWFNEYILNHPAMIGGRAPGKVGMQSSVNFLNSNWQPISVIIRSRIDDTAEHVANFIQGLINNGIVNDPSHIALLFRSTRESPRNAGPYTEELRNLGINIYNPRSRRVHEFPEVQQLIGCLLEILDKTISGSNPPQGQYQRNTFFPLSDTIHRFLSNCRREYLNLVNAGNFLDLINYIYTSLKNIELKGGNEWIETPIQKILYKNLNLSPFRERLRDPNWAPRYGVITSLLEGFCSIYNGNFQRSSNNSYLIKRTWTDAFYRVFCGLIVKMGLNEYEDPIQTIPSGFVQIMTYHQSKGLEFPYILMGSLGNQPRSGLEHLLEERFMSYRRFPYNLTEARIRAQQDDIRLFYMGFSRAKLGLILFTNNLRRCENSFGYDINGNRRNNLTLLRSKSISINN